MGQRSRARELQGWGEVERKKQGMWNLSLSVKFQPVLVIKDIFLTGPLSPLVPFEKIILFIIDSKIIKKKRGFLSG